MRHGEWRDRTKVGASVVLSTAFGCLRQCSNPAQQGGRLANARVGALLFMTTHEEHSSRGNVPDRGQTFCGQ
jgi:hypothetical protein